MAETTYTFSRNHTYIVAVIIVIVIVALLIKAVRNVPPVIVKPDESGQRIKDGKVVPISKELKDFLRNEDYTTIIFIRNGRIKTVDEEGRDMKPCGVIKDGMVENIPGEDCRLKKTNIQNWNNISILRRITNPHGDCHQSGGTLECGGGGL